MKKFRIIGTRAAVEECLEYLRELNSVDVYITGMRDIPPNPLKPSRMGMDAATYFFVAMGAHLAASTLHDLGKWILTHSGPDDLKVEEMDGTEKGDKKEEV